MQTTTRTLTELQPAPYSSVEIAMDSKGVAKPVVKVYAEDAHAAADLALALYRKLVAELATAH